LTAVKIAIGLFAKTTGGTKNANCGRWAEAISAGKRARTSSGSKSDREPGNKRFRDNDLVKFARLKKFDLISYAAWRRGRTRRRRDGI
jgi:hypothetical protein